MEDVARRLSRLAVDHVSFCVRSAEYDAHHQRGLSHEEQADAAENDEEQLAEQEQDGRDDFSSLSVCSIPLPSVFVERDLICLSHCARGRGAQR
jgi:hypothetical protein